MPCILGVFPKYIYLYISPLHPKATNQHDHNPRLQKSRHEGDRAPLGWSGTKITPHWSDGGSFSTREWTSENVFSLNVEKTSQTRCRKMPQHTFQSHPEGGEENVFPPQAPLLTSKLIKLFLLKWCWHTGQLVIMAEPGPPGPAPSLRYGRPVFLLSEENTHLSLLLDSVPNRYNIGRPMTWTSSSRAKNAAKNKRLCGDSAAQKVFCSLGCRPCLLHRPKPFVAIIKGNNVAGEPQSSGSPWRSFCMTTGVLGVSTLSRVFVSISHSRVSCCCLVHFTISTVYYCGLTRIKLSLVDNWTLDVYNVLVWSNNSVFSPAVF